MPFPGGTALRGPLYVLGMLWYAMRDRIKHSTGREGFTFLV